MNKYDQMSSDTLGFCLVNVGHGCRYPCPCVYTHTSPIQPVFLGLYEKEGGKKNHGWLISASVGYKMLIYILV